MPRKGPGICCIAWPCAAAAILLMAGLSSAADAQQIYGWTDSNGDVTYSNLPPPKGVKIMDVIPDKPLSPAAVQEAARRSEISALNDRIRLLELEAARNKREVADYPGEPTASLPPLSGPCAPDAYVDCNSQWAPYYNTGFLQGGYRHHHDDHGHHDDGRKGGHAMPAPLRITPPPPGHAVPIAASPNKSSLQAR